MALCALFCMPFSIPIFINYTKTNIYLLVFIGLVIFKLSIINNYFVVNNLNYIEFWLLFVPETFPNILNPSH